MDHEDKESKTYVVKVKKYDSVTPKEFLKWRLILNEQMKIMDTPQVMKWS
jgi:hypothetical protein